MSLILDKINCPNDLRKLPIDKLNDLAKEMRDFILEVVATKEGHLGASLGVIELTIALHYYFDTPQDLLLWDVGHQAYGHKLLTKRKKDFENLRQWNGISGFPVRSESEYDAFGVGHSSTSISAVTGMALADKINSVDRKHIAIIGDASIASGMALEGLNHLGDTDLDVLIVLNDNNIGIDFSVGALQKHFNSIDFNSHSEFFEALGFHYKGAVDGHNINELLNAFDDLDKIKSPKVLHIKTVKGKGFEQAENDQVTWHSPGKFDLISGKRIKQKNSTPIYQEIIGNKLISLFKKHENIVAITPAMLTGSGLISLKTQFPNRVFDVGIAEQHAVTLAAGFATQKIIPFCVIYSTFLQRAYDQIIHDVALQNLPVVFLIDRAGIVGSDGATHHGYFDIAFMNTIPNLNVIAPLNHIELEVFLEKATSTKKPLAIRYPRGKIDDIFTEKTSLENTETKQILKGKKAAILSTGTIGNTIYEVAKNEDVSWFHFPVIKPLDKKSLKRIFKEYSIIITYEDGIKSGGFGSSILSFAEENNFKGRVHINAYPDEFIPHGSMKELNNYLGFDEKGIERFISQEINSL